VKKTRSGHTREILSSRSVSRRRSPPATNRCRSAHASLDLFAAMNFRGSRASMGGGRIGGRGGHYDSVHRLVPETPAERRARIVRIVRTEDLFRACIAGSIRGDEFPGQSRRYGWRPHRRKEWPLRQHPLTGAGDPRRAAGAHRPHRGAQVHQPWRDPAAVAHSVRCELRRLLPPPPTRPRRGASSALWTSSRTRQRRHARWPRRRRRPQRNRRRRRRTVEAF
jgi:hypothetical protein